MKEILLAPPVAFLAYLIFVGILSGIGRAMAPKSTSSGVYAGGEASPVRAAAPGYRQFFVVALFFAVVHLGVLIVGSGDLSSTSGIYLVGLILALLALILG
jgi:NADH:ubiquinone oxidoreductase subunit 3 (subunit A)